MQQIKPSRLRPLPAALAVALLLGACTTANETPRSIDVKREISLNEPKHDDRDASAEVHRLESRAQEAVAGAKLPAQPYPATLPYPPQPPFPRPPVRPNGPFSSLQRKANS